MGREMREHIRVVTNIGVQAEGRGVGKAKTGILWGNWWDLSY